MAVDWFYADAQRQQQGPVPAARLAEMFRSGVVNAETLVWRDGLASWMPLRSVAAQLGLIVVGGAPPPLPQQASGGVRAPGGAIVKPTGSGGTAGLVVVLAIGGFVVISILAAIALPAYQDYSTRAKVTQVAVVAQGMKVQVSEFRDSEKRCPKNGDSGFGAKDSFVLPYVASVEIGPLKDSGRCALRFTLKGLGPSATEGKRLLFSLGDGDDWQVSSDLPDKFLPQSMRQH